MEKINKLYAKFLEATSRETDKKIILKKFKQTFKNLKFTSEEEHFNSAFIDRLYEKNKKSKDILMRNTMLIEEGRPLEMSLAEFKRLQKRWGK
jgi:hypothetical protein